MSDDKSYVVLANFCGWSHKQAKEIESSNMTNVHACVNTTDGDNKITINGKELPVCTPDIMEGVTAFPAHKTSKGNTQLGFMNSSQLTDFHK